MARVLSAILFFFFFGMDDYASYLYSPDKSSNDKVSLTSSDQKKLDKADKETQKSKDLLKEADKIYADIAAKQSELTAEETEKLNNKALLKQIEALKVLQSADKMKFEVYSAKADEFWKKFQGNPDDMSYAKSLESGARINFQSAQDQFKEAEGTKDKLLSYTTMTSASDLSSKAVEDMKKAFDIYSNTSFTQTTFTQPVVETKKSDSIPVKTDTTAIQPVIVKPVAKDTSSANIYRAMKINEDMVDKFNKFMKDEYPKDYEKYIIDFPSLDYSDVESIRAAWYKYLFGEETAEKNAADTTKKGTADSTLLAQQDTSKMNKTGTNETVSGETLAKLKSKTKQKSGVTAGQQSNEEVSGQKFYKGKKLKRTAEDYMAGITDTTEVKGFTFRVQIVASRVPLSPEMLQKIYGGPEKPEETYEYEWYKYSIGPFSNYALARQFRESCQVPDAFIVAFVHGRKINPDEALILPGENSKSFINFSIDKSIIFKVQVAACRSEMPVEELKRIYYNSEELESNQEEGWYKYSINCGNDFSKACDLLKSIRIAGAFIAAYKDGQHIDLKAIFSENSQSSQ